MSWHDENITNPKRNGEYLCLLKWYNLPNYEYSIVEYDIQKGWVVTDSCEHILWTKLKPKPKSV